MFAGTVVGVLKNLVSFLDDDKKDYCLVRRVEQEIEALQKEVITLNSFLKNYEEVEEAMDRIKGVSRKAVDAVDTYRAEIIEIRRRGRGRLLGKVHHYCCLFRRRKRLRDAAKEMRSVRNAISLIYSKKDRYGSQQEGQNIIRGEQLLKSMGIALGLLDQDVREYLLRRVEFEAEALQRTLAAIDSIFLQKYPGAPQTEVIDSVRAIAQEAQGAVRRHMEETIWLKRRLHQDGAKKYGSVRSETRSRLIDSSIRISGILRRCGDVEESMTYAADQAKTTTPSTSEHNTLCQFWFAVKNVILGKKDGHGMHQEGDHVAATLLLSMANVSRLLADDLEDYLLRRVKLEEDALQKALVDIISFPSTIHSETKQIAESDKFQEVVDSIRAVASDAVSGVDIYMDANVELNRTLLRDDRGRRMKLDRYKTRALVIYASERISGILSRNRLQGGRAESDVEAEASISSELLMNGALMDSVGGLTVSIRSVSRLVNEDEEEYGLCSVETELDDQVEALQKELDTITSFLANNNNISSDQAEPTDENHQVQKVIDQIRNLVREAVDAVSSYMDKIKNLRLRDAVESGKEVRHEAGRRLMHSSEKITDILRESRLLVDDESLRYAESKATTNVDTEKDIKKSSYDGKASSSGLKGRALPLTDSVAELLVSMGKVSKLLDQDVQEDLLRRAELEMEAFQKEQVPINSFLWNSEAERTENHQVQGVVARISEVAREASDAVDSYMAEIIGRKERLLDAVAYVRSARYSSQRCVINSSEIIHGILRRLLEGDDESSRSTGTVKYAEAAAAEATTSTPSKQEHTHSYRWRRAGFDHVVGFDHETETLVSLLVQGDPRLDVVSITGMGGLGKTTLASKIYGHKSVKKHFVCQAWVSVSQKCKTKDYLLGILGCLVPSIPEETYKVSEDELKLTLRAFLREKRYLIVLDDLRTTHVWDEIRDAFPNSFNGSRMLITGNKHVALFASQIPSYSLSPLDEETSWKFLRSKVNPIIKRNPDLEAPGKQLVRSCKGVPLAILVLGGLLAHQEEKYETWSKLLSNVTYSYSQNAQSLDILEISYNLLPQNLKPCFLHLSVFPVDFEISARYLFKLWLAEGFVRETETAEAVADNYLEELAARSMVRVTKRRTDGGAKTCQIHDLLRHLSIEGSWKEKFLEVRSESNPASISSARELPIFESIRKRFLEVFSEYNSTSETKARRLSIQGNISEYISSHPNIQSRLHSLLLFGEGNDFNKKHWRWVFKNFKFLRVLCLERLCLNSIPKNIENLIFLRYLRMWSEKVIEIAAIPASICNLQFLEEIDINGHVEECLPKEIWTMKQLRTLRFSGGMSIPAAPKSEDNPPIKLHVLSYVHVDENTKCLMFHTNFPNLNKLHLKYDDGLAQMNEFEVADVLESLSPKQEEESESLKKLESLKILDFPASEPRSKLFPSTLVKITFIRSYFNSTHFGILAKLPKLKILKLKGKFPYYGVVSSLRCDAGDFPELQALQMVDLEFDLWILESGAMNKLQHLVISECYRLRNVPKELVNLSALTLVEVSRMSQSFKKMLKELDLGVKCKVLIDSKPFSGKKK